jgi:lysophospholipase L1-like esterase
MIVTAFLRSSLKTALISCFACSWLLVPSQNPGVEPHERLNEQWWKDRHEHCLRMTLYGRADVAFLGDSITQGWEGDGDSVWDTEVAPFKAANFGFSGDRTDHVLWRLQQGELIGMRPKLIVVMIGTNNIGQGGTPEDAAKGVRAIVQYLTDKLPKSRILLLGIFPRGQTTADPLRQRVAEATAMFKECANGERVKFLDIGSQFLQPDGTLSIAMFPDSLHPNASGYVIWARAIEPVMKEMLARR